MRISTVRRLLSVAAVLGAFVAVAGEPGADGRPRASAPPASADLPRPVPGITLYFFDVQHQFDAQFDEIAAETHAIFHDMGAEVTWRVGGLGTTYGSAGTPEIPVIVLDTPPKGIANSDTVLGLVPRQTPGSKAIWIFASNLRRTLGAETSRGLGVAAGRVIAHEVVHSLAPALPHAKEGLMRDTLSRAALIDPTRPEHQRCVAAVQAALGILSRAAVAVPKASALFLQPPLF